MSVPIQVRRGTTSERLATVLDSGEPGWDTTEKKLYVGDGSTAGGIAVGSIPEAPEDGKTYGRKDGDWAEVTSGGGSGGIAWQTVSAATTMSANTAYIVTAAVDMTLPASVSAGDQFIVHALGASVRIVSNGNVINRVGSGNNLTLADKQTAWLVSQSAGNLEIV